MWNALRSVVIYTFLGGMSGAWLMLFIHARWLLLLFGFLMIVVMMNFMGLFVRFSRLMLPLWHYGSGFVAFVVALFSATLGVGGGLLSSKLLFSERVIPVRAVAGTASAFCIVVSAGSVVSALFLSYTTEMPWSLGTINLVGFLVLSGSAFVTIPVSVSLANRLSRKTLLFLFVLMCFAITLYAFTRAWLLF